MAIRIRKGSLIFSTVFLFVNHQQLVNERTESLRLGLCVILFPAHRESRQMDGQLEPHWTRVIGDPTHKATSTDGFHGCSPPLSGPAWLSLASLSHAHHEALNIRSPTQSIY